jgi:cyanophycinase
MTPRGKLMLIGGNVDKGTALTEKDESPESLRFFDLGILERIVTELRGNCSRIELITAASQIPEEVGQEYIKAFNKISCGNVGVLPESEIQSDSPEVAKRIRDCDGVMFTGGSQATLIKKLKNTKVIKEIKGRYHKDENFLVSGTSAGAMALPNLMIEKGSPSESLVKGNVIIGTGFGLLENLMVDTHFVQRGRFSRLIEAIAFNPGLLGIGLGEDTAVLLKDGIFETVGNNLVSLIDGRSIRKNNYKTISTGEAVCVEHMVLHVLATGHQFDLKKRRVL